MERGARRLLCRKDSSSRLRGACGDHPRLPDSQGALRGPADGIQAGPDRYPLPHHGRGSGLLPLFSQPRRPSGALRLRILRRRAFSPLRRHLLRAATGQLLAGRGQRLSATRPYLSTPECHAALRRDRADYRGRQSDPGISRPTHGSGCLRPLTLRSRPATDRHGGQRTGPRPRPLQPRRSRNPARHRATRLRRAKRPPCHLQGDQDRARPPRRLGKADPRSAAQEQSGMTTQPAPQHDERLLSSPNLDESYAICRAIAKREAKNFYYSFVALPHARRNAICAIYAFMRKADDLSDDESLPREERRRQLDGWLAVWHQAREGAVTEDPVFVAV